VFTWEYYYLLASLGGNALGNRPLIQIHKHAFRTCALSRGRADLFFSDVPASSLDVNRGFLVEGFRHRIEPTQSDDMK